MLAASGRCVDLHDPSVRFPFRRDLLLRSGGIAARQLVVLPGRPALDLRLRFLGGLPQCPSLIVVDPDLELHGVSCRRLVTSCATRASRSRYVVRGIGMRTSASSPTLHLVLVPSGF